MIKIHAKPSNSTWLWTFHSGQTLIVPITAGGWGGLLGRWLGGEPRRENCWGIKSGQWIQRRLDLWDNRLVRAWETETPDSVGTGGLGARSAPIFFETHLIHWRSARSAPKNNNNSCAQRSILKSEHSTQNYWSRRITWEAIYFNYRYGTHARFCFCFSIPRLTFSFSLSIPR